MLLDDIITILSSEKESLNEALLKTKVLLHTIGKKDLAAWVTNESKGYAEGSDVPEYRVITAQPHADVTNIAWQMANYALPVFHLKKEDYTNLTQSKCVLSISSIEESVRAFRAKGQGLIRPLLAGDNYFCRWRQLFFPVFGFHQWSTVGQSDALGVRSSVSESDHRFRLYRARA